MTRAESTGTIMDYAGHDLMGSEAPGTWRKREHETGVSFTCPWEDPFSGFPEHCRRLARALDDAGHAVHLRSFDPSMQWHKNAATAKDKARVQTEYQDLLTRSIQNYLVAIHMVVASDGNFHRLTTHRYLDPEHLKAVNSFKIISTVFERDRISDSARDSLNRVAQVWVANPYDRDMLARCGVEEKKLRVVPIPIFPDDPHLKLAGAERDPGPVRFYHIGKWEHRKAHHEMFGAFLMAFKPGEAKLYFKTSSKAPDFGTYPSSPEESISRWLQDSRVINNGWDLGKANEDIFLITRFISPEQLLQLHKTGDVYLSLSRGEGFDMPAYDAKLSGNLMVYTPSGGPQSFAQPGDIRVEASGKTPCHPFYNWDGCKYLSWPVEDAATAMREAKQRIERGDKFTPSDWSAFTAKTVGAQMRGYIDEITEGSRR